MKKLILAVVVILFHIAAIQAQSPMPKVNEKGKYGYVNREGAQVIPFIYQEAYPFKNGVAKVCKGKKYGFINENGEEVIPVSLDRVAPFKDGVAWVKEGNKYGFISDKGEIIAPVKYAAVGSFDENGFAWVNADGKVDKTGNLSGGKYGIISKTGATVIPAEFKCVGTFAANEKNPAFRFAGAMASVMSYAPMDALRPSVSPYFWFSKNLEGEKAGIVNADGQIVVPADTYDLVYPPTDGMARVMLFSKKKTTEGFFNIETKTLLGVKETDAKTPAKKGPVYYAYDNGVCKVSDGDVFYFIDKEGAKITGDYSYAADFENGLCVVGKGGVFGAIDPAGKAVIPFEYEDLGQHFSEGLLSAKKGKWGHIDASGNVAIPFEYDGVSKFTWGWAFVKQGNLLGIIDRTNRAVVPVQFDNIGVVTEKEPVYLWVQLKQRWYCYDREKAALAFDKGYVEVCNFVDGAACVKDTGGFGIVNRQGDVLVPCKMESAGEARDAYAYMQRIKKERLNATDLLRLGIYKDGARNGFGITQVIPEARWDY